METIKRIEGMFVEAIENQPRAALWLFISLLVVVAIVF